MTLMLRDEIARMVAKAIKRAQKEGDLPEFDIPVVPVEHPKQAGWGDYSSGVCMQLARVARMAPVKIAEQVVRRMGKAEFLGKTEVAHPGFLNFSLDNGWVSRQVDDILAKGDTYGNLDLGKGKKVQVEYGSANPTGPLHVGTGRNVVIGDTIANVLVAGGYDVQREYYVNDAGARMRVFFETLFARYAQALGKEGTVPEDGYHGAYMVELGKTMVEEHGTRFLDMPRDQALVEMGRLGLDKMVDSARTDLEQLGIRYDRWFSEQSLYDDGAYDRIMTILREGDYLAMKDGAIWFHSEGLADDEVLVRRDGTPLYFASDIAYHHDKFVVRGFEWVIDVWGADHQGHVPRMHQVMKALGKKPEQLTIVLYQLVTLKRGGEIIRLSKRTGDIITLHEVMEDVGPDAVRFFLLAKTADSQMDFDLDLAKQQSQENPVYYVQYAHARIASILRFGEETDRTEFQSGDVSLLATEPEQNLIRELLKLPEVLEVAVKELAPHRLTYYAQSLAGAFHSFYKECRVLSSEPGDEGMNKARLKLALATKIVLARTLRLMGVAAPERM